MQLTRGEENMCKRRSGLILHENVAQIGQKCKTKANAFDFSQSQKLRASKQQWKMVFQSDAIHFNTFSSDSSIQF